MNHVKPADRKFVLVKGDAKDMVIEEVKEEKKVWVGEEDECVGLRDGTREGVGGGEKGKKKALAPKKRALAPPTHGVLGSTMGNA